MDESSSTAPSAHPPLPSARKLLKQSFSFYSYHIGTFGGITAIPALFGILTFMLGGFRGSVSAIALYAALVGFGTAIIISYTALIDAVIERGRTARGRYWRIPERLAHARALRLNEHPCGFFGNRRLYPSHHPRHYAGDMAQFFYVRALRRKPSWIGCAGYELALGKTLLGVRVLDSSGCMFLLSS